MPRWERPASSRAFTRRSKSRLYAAVWMDFGVPIVPTVETR